MRYGKKKSVPKYQGGGALGTALGAAAMGNPLGLALTGLQVGLGAYQTIAGAQAAKKADAMDVREASIAKPGEYAEMLKQAKDSEVSRRQVEEMNRTLGTSVGALGAAGGRALLGGIQGVTAQADRQKLDLLQQQQQDILRAQELSARGSEAEIGRQMQREQQDIAAKQLAQSQAQQAMGAGIGNIFGAISSFGEQQAYMKGMTGFGAAKESDMLKGRNSKGKMGYEEGGTITKTPGKFSHKSNPIDVVQDGTKIAEMTGGEYIFNPTQATKLMSMSKDGDTPLHKYVRGLLNKFESNK